MLKPEAMLTLRECRKTPQQGVRLSVGFLLSLLLLNDLLHTASAWTAHSSRHPSTIPAVTTAKENRCIYLKAQTDGVSEGHDHMSLQELLLPSTSCDVGQMSTTDLAYIGDVVYELFIRSRTVWPPKRTSDLQLQVVALVRAEHQSRLLALMKEEFPFTSKELQVLSRGRNSVSGSGNRRDPAAYQDATALEAVVGFLYITDSKRCEEMLNWIHNNLERVS